MTIQFTVYGVAQTAGSKRGFSRGGRVLIVDDNPKAESWKQEVRAAACRAAGEQVLAGPVALCVRYYLPRPKGHFGSGRNADKLKGSAPLYPTGRPDALKLTRCLEDALTGVLWGDDSQIVDEGIAKRYCAPGEPARAEVYVTQILERYVDDEE